MDTETVLVSHTIRDTRTKGREGTVQMPKIRRGQSKDVARC